MTVFDVENYFLLGLTFVLLTVKIVALVNSLLWSPEHYRAADRLTKPAWVAILALAVATEVLVPGVWMLNLAFTIAAIVYLVDVRPALTSLRQR